MKKKSTKLQFNRETLRNLTEGNLRGAAGGATAWPTCGCPTNISNCADCPDPSEYCDTQNSCTSFRC